MVRLGQQRSIARLSLCHRALAREGNTPIMPWIRELMRYRELLYMLSWREVRIRYKQSVMGLLWAVLMPVIITMAGVVVRVAATKLSGRPVSGADVGAIGVKALPWAFFISALRFGTMSLAGNSNLVTKIKFPRLVFPLSAVLTSLVDLAVASPLLLILLPLSGVHLAWTMLWAPILLLVLVLFTVGLTVLCSAANLFFRDVKYIVEVILTFAIFFTPVLYDADMVGSWRSLVMLNPVAPLLEGLNAAVVRGHAPDLGWVAYSTGMAVLFCWGGVAFFRRLEPRFAESV
jgi:ABC-type polysaccharide/polyol phosphate export permease